MKPWHDTVQHDGCGLPVVPFEQCPPLKARNPSHVMCAGCGKDWIEKDLPSLLQVWWSAGAYDGKWVEECSRP